MTDTTDQTNPADQTDPTDQTGSTPSTAPTESTPPALTMYTTSWCGYCRRLKAGLEREGIAFVEVDIEYDPSAAELVANANRGNHTVPTVFFADGSSLTNPSVVEVISKLAA